MLKLSKNILDLPVMSLRTGGKVAVATEPIINPHNLKIEGWYCIDTFDKKLLILLASDVRDFVPQGIAINDYDVLSEPGDLIRLKEVLDLKFEIKGKAVVTNRRRKLGKVEDYALNVKSMRIQKLYVSRPLYKSLSDGQLSIDRSQIIEITNRKVIVREAEIKVEAPASSPLPA